MGSLHPFSEEKMAWLDKAKSALSVTIRMTLDLEQRTIAEKDLAKAKEDAEAANKTKSAFLANMSHELRTPMNAIIGYSEMLMEEAEDVGQEGFIPDLKKINQAGNHLLSLINSVLDLSKIESGRMEAYAENFEIDNLIDMVSGTAQPLMAKNNNHFEIKRAPHLGSAFQDVTKLRQALLNLISNAAKFTHEGTITLSIKREISNGIEWLIMSVSDTGIGIPEDKLDYVFEEFSQADSSTTRNYGGTGLGLAISKRFCQMLGGDITVTSKPGMGSVFTISLPAILPGADLPAPAQSQPPQTVDSPNKLELVQRSNTVLVIDDDIAACEIIKRLLEKDHFNVIVTNSGQDGLRIAHETPLVAITLDVTMGGMDGWSVLGALKADPRLKDIPVVMLTGIDDKGKGYSLGATDYLVKPVNREQLTNALQKFFVPNQVSSVMLVEDDLPTRSVMARLLEKMGWTVYEAGNGQEALDLLSQHKPNLILLDLMMPVMDGFEFLTRMRVNSDWVHIPVMVLTAKDLTPEDRNVLKDKVSIVIEKGTNDYEEVARMIRQVAESPTPSVS
jgi:signal transduction histidine kinase/CheY-like chemotaxis protein